MNCTGFLYIATGERFINEAKASVASLKQRMPSARTCCFTDDPASARDSFDQVELIASPHRNFFEKIPPLSLTPFERTIFVDTDTVFAAPMDDVFDLLEKFEIAVASDPFFCGPPGIPDCFSHLNTGLIAYQNTPRVRDFFQNWFSNYTKEFTTSDNKSNCHDQISFQKTLYESDLRLYVLPTEYNFRITCPQLVRIWAPVKMLHARHSDLVALGDRLNSNGDVKVVWPNFAHYHRAHFHVVSTFQERIFRLIHWLPKTIMGMALRGKG